MKRSLNEILTSLPKEDLEVLLGRPNNKWMHGIKRNGDEQDIRERIPKGRLVPLLEAELAKR